MANEIDPLKDNNRFSAHSAIFLNLKEKQKLKTDETIYIEDVVKKTNIASFRYEFKNEGSLSIIDKLVDVDEPAWTKLIYKL